jgi:hypothetical protein
MAIRESSIKWYEKRYLNECDDSEGCPECAGALILGVCAIACIANLEICLPVAGVGTLAGAGAK